MPKEQKDYVVIGSTSLATEGSVFTPLRLPSGNTAWVLDEHVYRKATDEANRVLREILARQSSELDEPA